MKVNSAKEENVSIFSLDNVIKGTRNIDIQPTGQILPEFNEEIEAIKPVQLTMEPEFDPELSKQILYFYFEGPHKNHLRFKSDLEVEIRAHNVIGEGSN